jgi:hypothetical protein
VLTTGGLGWGRHGELHHWESACDEKLFLGLAGIHGDKKKGIEQLETAANHGHYLQPFAKILLALTALREKRPEVARAQFTELVAEFPENSLFASELAKVNLPSAGPS